MRTIILILFTLLITSACNVINLEISCSEFYVKNELSSEILFRNYKLFDSGYYFSLDSFAIGPNETKMVNQDCRYVDSIIPYPKGAYTKIFFKNRSSKTDTFSSNGTLYLRDSINVYNRNRWIIVGDNKLRKATYIVTLNDSLEAR